MASTLIKRHANDKRTVEMVAGWHGQKHVFLRLLAEVAEIPGSQQYLKAARFESREAATDAWNRSVAWVNAAN